jgi:acetate kinase
VSRAILVVNAGSSSIKFAIYPAESGQGGKAALFHGALDGIGHAAHLKVRDSKGKAVADLTLANPSDHEAALSALLKWIEAHSGGLELAAVGHRVVHGGGEFGGPVRITPQVMQELAKFSPLAPLHQPHNLGGIAAFSKLHPALPQVACFDTSFHMTQPVVATTFALPRALTEKGVRRYGFHGISYEYIAGILPDHLGARADGKVIVAHLGNGASMCAMDKRRSVATTMGFSALDGLMMGTRSGAIDPGVLLYLLQQGMSHEALNNLLYKESGLLGVSGISEDMRDLLASADPRAAEAIELFVYRIVRELGSLVAALGGLDALVFTAGIGEHAAEIRARVCRDVACFGVTLDEAANTKGGPRISGEGSAVSAWALPTDEEWIIARHTRALM